MKLITLFFAFFYAFVSTLALPILASADGAFFISDTYREEDLTEPEQKAVLLFDGTKEELIIQAKASGSVPHFAWVIPVPSYPKLKEGDSAMFEELHVITAPRQVSKVSIRLFDFFLFIKGTSFSSNLLDGVTLHESKKVGIFDASILSAKGGNDLIQWLHQNNFQIPQEAVSILDGYIEKDWYFVALKVNELNIPVLSSLNKIDGRIVSIESAREVIASEVIANLKGEPNNISAFTNFRYHISEEEIESMRNRYFYIPNNKRELQIFTEDASLGKLQKQYETFLSNKHTYVEKYVLVRGWSGTCNSHHKDNYCIFESGFGFYFGESYSDLNGVSAIEKYLGVTGKEDLRSEIRAHISDDILNQRPYEQSFVYKMRKAGLMDATISYDEVNGERLPKTDENIYKDLLLTYRSPEESIRSQVSAGLLRELFNPLGLSYNETNQLLTPVSLTFESTEPIYPLKISSINGGETEVLLYTFSDSYLTGTGLQLEYAGKPIINERESVLGDALSERSSLSNLTKLRGVYQAEEMTSDVVLKQDPRQREYRMIVFANGTRDWLIDLLISMMTLYLWGLIMAAIARKIVNKISKPRPYLGIFSKHAMFIYPTLGVVLLGLVALFKVLGLTSQVLVIPFICMYFLPPMLSTIAVFIVLHFIQHFVLRIKQRGCVG